MYQNVMGLLLLLAVVGIITSLLTDTPEHGAITPLNEQLSKSLYS